MRTAEAKTTTAPIRLLQDSILYEYTTQLATFTLVHVFSKWNFWWYGEDDLTNYCDKFYLRTAFSYTVM